MKRLLGILAACSFIACPGKTDKESLQEENTVLGLIVLASYFGNLCESKPIVNLTVGVAFGPHTAINCYVVSTTGPATITVNSGSGTAHIESKHPAVVGQVPQTYSIVNPTGSITQATVQAKFEIWKGIANQVTVTVN